MRFRVIFARESASKRLRGVADDIPNDPTIAARRS
jgi:hypothetical protein